MSVIVIFVVALAVVSSIIVPLFLQHRIQEMHREDQRALFARDDAIAARLQAHQEQQAEAAREVAARLHKAQAETLRRTDEIAAAEAASREITNGKLDIIHRLVNSNMTAAIKAELDAQIALLATMYENIELKRDAGHDPAPEALMAIEAVKARIAEGTALLADRAQQAQALIERKKPKT